MKIAAIIAAAGSGRRFGFKKQFALINGKWVLEYSVEAFRDICEDIVIVAQKEDMQKIQNRFDFAKVIEGGKERMHSVYNGLTSVSCDMVMIHDAARPLVNKALIERLIESALKNESGVPVLNITETIKRVESDKITETIDRSGLFSAQTPQAFDYKKLKNAYDMAVKSGKLYTDEAGIWEKYYGYANTVMGERKNIKITLREDLEIIGCLLG